LKSTRLVDRIRAVPQSSTGVLARRLVLLLGVYLAVRIAFLVNHVHQFRDLSLLTLLGAFVHGVRFDAAAIVYSNAPFILLSLMPAALLQQAWYQRALFALFTAINGALVLIMVGDVGYYPFTGTRVTAEVVALSGEALAQADQLIVNFAGLVTFGVALMAALIMLYARQRPEAIAPRSWYGAAAVIVAVVGLGIVGARGGVQKKPLKPIHAFASGHHDTGVLTLNTTFTLLHSLRTRQLEPVVFFSNDRAAEQILAAPFGYTAPADAPATSPQNVMLIILESFSNEHWGGDARELVLTPFLDSLAAHGAFFTDNFANGQRSMDALPSILLGVPLLMGESIAVSGYQGNLWQGLGHFLDGAGYHTSMFHGAKKGTMYFDAIAGMAGIREFYPLERYPEARQAEDFDRHWGLYDEPFLQFVAEEVGTFRQPFFSTVFTISTHHPYRVPPSFRHTLAPGEAEFHRSVRYVDFALQRFFDTARTQPWFENTLFILVGDHTPPARSSRYDTPIGRHMVPLLLYHPMRRLPTLDTRRVTQHVDLFRTVLDYVGVNPGRAPLFGRSLFAPVEGAAVLQANGTFWLVTRDVVLERDPAGRERLLTYERERTGTRGRTSRRTASASGPDRSGPARSDRAAELSARLRANLQHFTSSMIGNTFYREPSSRSRSRAPR
jgi:phosphoglycerol transferase MdoB-like AlkP superfamily enzyme